MRTSLLQNLFSCYLKLIQYSIYVINIVSSNQSVGPLPRIKRSFFLFSTYTDKLISTPNIITFLPIPLLCYNKTFSRASNTTLYPGKEHLLGAVFLVNLIAPNKEFSKQNQHPAFMTTNLSHRKYKSSPLDYV